MAKSNVLYLCVWSGDAEVARDLVGSRYPGIEIREFPHRQAQNSRIHCSGFVCYAAFAAEPSSFTLNPSIILSTGRFWRASIVLHRCQDTVLCDKSGRWEVNSKHRFLPIGSRNSGQYPA